MRGGVRVPGDTASGVRARGVLALARQAWRDLPLLAAELLEDGEGPVRIAAADALGAHGSRDGAGALISRLARGDEDPMVVIAAFAALLALAPEWALDVARRGIRGGATVDRELTAIALGESRRDDALDLLVEWLERSVVPSDRETYLRAIGLHRTDRAATILLARIAEGSPDDARTAIEALAPRRFDPGMTARAREAAKGRDALLRLIDIHHDPSP
jgi:HEAT repeat protein